MKISDLIMMSLRNLWRRKLRTILTILGVVIGTTSTVLMVSLGFAMEMNFRQQMEDMQSLTVIDVYSNGYNDESAPKLDSKGIESIEAYPEVEMVIPMRETRAYLEFGKYRTTWEINIRGMSTEEMDALGYEVGKGEVFASKDEEAIILGEELLREFVKNGQQVNWNAPPPPIEFDLGVDELEIDIGQYDWESGDPQINYEGNSVRPPDLYGVTVVGLFGSESWENAYSATIPVILYDEMLEEKLEYQKKLYGEDYEIEDPSNYNSVKVKVFEEEQVVTVLDKLNDAGYQTYSPVEYLQEMTQVSSSIQLMLSAIGGISLLVAAIGIANTMMMSIYERTKEIGVMKVIGARLTDIRKMFLFEALTIGALGGTVGVLFSYMISYIMNNYGQQILGDMLSVLNTGGNNISVITLPLAFSALVFSTFIGLIAGYFPARRAMKLSALSAIKTE